MINSFKLIAAAVFLGICAVSMSGVRAQVLPVTTVRVIQLQGDFTMALANLSTTYGVTVGLEVDNQRYQKISLSLMDANVTDVMNALVQSSKKYDWRQTDKFIDVWPLAGSHPLLDTRINSFNVKDLNASEALDQLFSLPEVQANMTTCSLKRRAPD